MKQIRIMKAKEKARDLFLRYEFWIISATEQYPTKSKRKEIAKECALICVDEKLKSLIKIRKLVGVTEVIELIKYENELREVKQEIVKL